MIRARLVRQCGAALQFIHYVGPLALVPAGWFIVTRKPVNRSK